jgi:cytosine/adenosine deaminase-related metal-dependent hydrolase
MEMGEMSFKCDLITGDGEVIRGTLIVNGKAYFEEKDVESKFIVSPSFFNSHVHLGDSLAKDPPFLSLEELVGPKGFKHTLKQDISAIKNSIELAFSSGTSTLADFREGGIKGLEILKKADERRVCMPFARPLSVEEAEKLAEVDYAVGFGMSSIRDHDLNFLEEIRRIAARKGKLFAIHAGERDAGDVDDAISLDPDLLVHMNMAEGRQVKHVMDEEIPIVSCIRSNAFFGLLNLKIYKMLSSYEKWLLGTDNVMVSSPLMLSELSFSSYILKKNEEVFKAAVRGFEIFGRKPSLVIFHKRRNLSNSLNPLASVMRRADAMDIEMLINQVFEY